MNPSKKIVFISLHNPESIGVNVKVHRQVEFFRNSGLDVHSIFLNDKHPEDHYDHNNRIQYLTTEKPELHPIFYRRYIRNYNDLVLYNKWLNVVFKKIENQLKALGSFDLIYFRYPHASYPLLKFTKKYAGKIVFEHNTKEDIQIKSQLSDKPYMQYEYLCEKYLAKWIFKKALMGVAVSADFGNYEDQRAGFNYVKFIYPNPIDVKNTPTRKKFPKEGNYKFLAYIGNYSHWHGLDLFVNAVKNSTDKNSIELTYVGRRTKFVKELLDGISYKIVEDPDGSEFETIIENVDIALGSLAFFRLDIKESSSLKTKEYISHGIPFVISAPDVACNNEPEAISPYFLKIDPSETSFPLEEILDFTKKIRTMEDHPEKMHEYGIHHLDYRPVYNRLIKAMYNELELK